MKILKYVCIVIGFTSLVNAQADKKIKDLIDRNAIIRNAIKTKNEDLIKKIEQTITKIDWKQVAWQESLSINVSYELEALAIVNSILVNNYKQYFLDAPDVPYDEIGHWHMGYFTRGLQGKIIVPLATYHPEKFIEITKLLDDPSISLSKKRTIVWAMSEDLSGMSEKLLVAKIESAKDLLKKDMVRSLRQVRRNVKTTRDVILTNLSEANTLVGTSIHELSMKIGAADTRLDTKTDVIYTYEDRNQIIWTLTVNNGRVTKFEKKG